MAEHGFFVKEMNTGWREWEAAQLPVHGDHDLAQGVVHCSCSLDAGQGDAAAAAPH